MNGRPFGIRWPKFFLRTAFLSLALLGAFLASERHVVTERWSIRHTYERDQVAEFSSSALSTEMLGLAPSDPTLARVNWLRGLLGDEAIDSITVWKPSAEVEQALQWFPEAQIIQSGPDPFLSPQRLPAATAQQPPPTPSPIGSAANGALPLDPPAIQQERFVD